MITSTGDWPERLGLKYQSKDLAKRFANLKVTYRRVKTRVPSGSDLLPQTRFEFIEELRFLDGVPSVRPWEGTYSGDNAQPPETVKRRQLLSPPPYQGSLTISPDNSIATISDYELSLPGSNTEEQRQGTGDSTSTQKAEPSPTPGPSSSSSTPRPSSSSSTARPSSSCSTPYKPRRRRNKSSSMEDVTLAGIMGAIRETDPPPVAPVTAPEPSWTQMGCICLQMYAKTLNSNSLEQKFIERVMKSIQSIADDIHCEDILS